MLSNIKLALTVLFWSVISGINPHVNAFDTSPIKWTNTIYLESENAFQFELTGSPSQVCVIHDSGLAVYELRNVTMKRKRLFHKDELITYVEPWVELGSNPVTFKIPADKFKHDETYELQLEIDGCPHFDAEFELLSDGKSLEKVD